MNQDRPKVRVRPVPRTEPELRRLARVLIELAIAKQKEEDERQSRIEKKAS